MLDEKFQLIFLEIDLRVCLWVLELRKSKFVPNQISGLTKIQIR